MKYDYEFFPVFPVFKNKFCKFMATITMIIALFLYLGFDFITDIFRRKK